MSNSIAQIPLTQITRNPDQPRPKVLTVRQPWASFIVSGHKTIENRTWITNYRGSLYIHAGSRMHETPIAEIESRHKIEIDRDALHFGALVGRVQLVDIVTKSDDPFFIGPYGWVLENPEPLDPIPMSGAMGLFDLPADIMRRYGLR